MVEGESLIFRPQPYTGFVLAEATLNGEPFVSSDGIFYRTSLTQNTDIVFRFEEETPAPDDTTVVEQTFRLNVSYNEEGGRVIMGDSTLLPGDFSEKMVEGESLIFRPQPYTGFVLAEATLNGEPFVSSDGIFYRTSLTQSTDIVFRFEEESSTPDDTTVVEPEFHALWIAYDRDLGIIHVNDTLPAPFAGNVSSDETVKISVRPNEGYQVKQVVCNEEVISDQNDTAYYVSLKEDALIQVLFDEEQEGSTEYTTLTIQGINGGTMEQEVAVGSTLNFRIVPDTGWSLHSVMFNDVDMTQLIDSSYLFTTPVLTEPSTLSIVFKELTSLLQQSHASAVKVYGQNGQIIIENMPANETARIYNELGILIKTIDGKSQPDARITIELTTQESYIVKIGSETYKLLL